MSFKYQRAGLFSLRFQSQAPDKRASATRRVDDRSFLKGEFRLITAALTALILGVLVYLLVRGPQNVYFLPDLHGLRGSEHPLLRQLTGSLPAFVHVYSFILLTAAILASWRRLAPVICLSWFAVEALMEIGQHPALSPILASHSPEIFAGIPYLETFPAFFLNGTFDPVDLAALAAGALSAWLSILLIRNGRCHDVR